MFMYLVVFSDLVYVQPLLGMIEPTAVLFFQVSRNHRPDVHVKTHAGSVCWESHIIQSRSCKLSLHLQSFRFGMTGRTSLAPTPVVPPSQSGSVRLEAG